jgi:hypothetical protein
MIAILRVILQLLGIAVTIATKNSAPQEAIDGLIAAITAVQQVHDTAVTKAQVDGLLDTPDW